MNKIVTGALVVLVLLLIGFTAYLFFDRSKIAYVRSQEILEKFHGTIEARKEFESRKQSMLQNIDSLKVPFEQLRTYYLTNSHKMSVLERQEREGELDSKHSQLLEYNKAVEDQIAEEDRILMKEVLDQINSSIKEFAEQEDYDVILGTTATGSLLYGNESLDVTDIVLEKLNKTYTGIQ